MKKLLLPLILALVGIGGGVGAGLFLTPAKEEMAEGNPCGDGHAVMAEATEAAAPEPGPISDREYARMNNQFVVPVVVDDRVSSLVVMSLSIEVNPGDQEQVFSHEPRLRDSFLQVMFDHANMGGFDGAFTSSSNMRLLREALREAAFEALDGHVTDVLIVDIVRQDVTN